MDNLIKLKEEDNPNYIWLYGSELANSIVSSSGTVSTLTCTGGGRRYHNKHHHKS